MDSESHDALLVFAASAVGFLSIDRPVSSLDASLRGRDDPLIVVIIFTSRSLPHTSRFFDIIVDGPLSTEGNP